MGCSPVPAASHLPTQSQNTALPNTTHQRGGSQGIPAYLAADALLFQLLSRLQAEAHRLAERHQSDVGSLSLHLQHSHTQVFRDCRLEMEAPTEISWSVRILSQRATHNCPDATPQKMACNMQARVFNGSYIFSHRLTAVMPLHPFSLHHSNMAEKAVKVSLQGKRTRLNDGSLLVICLKNHQNPTHMSLPATWQLLSTGNPPWPCQWEG
jgi:hypothetical protein